jgi:HAD superfamily hydrolase (TIGR01509 family)
VTTLPAAVIFDIDGVLIDSEPTSLAALADVYADYGHQISAGRLEKILGKHIDDAARLLSQEHPIPLTLVQIRDSYLGRYLPALRNCAPCPGAVELLHACNAEGIQLGLASSATGAEVRTVLDMLELGDTFAAVVSGDEVSRAKPSPDVYLLALERLGLPTTDVVAVEDSPHGVTAALAAGLRCVAITRDSARWAALPARVRILPSLSGVHPNDL